MKTILTAALATMLLAGTAQAQDAATYQDKTPAAQAQTATPSDLKLSVGLSASTDYVWRGVSQSDEKPAVFATLNASYKGFYAGAGTENIDFAGISQEYDLWAGYVLDLGPAKLELGVVRYGYVDAPGNIDTLEGKAALSGKVGKLALSGAVYHTENYFGSHLAATYGELAASYPVTGKLSLSGAVGRQEIDRAADYTTWNLGASYALFGSAKVDLRYHDTDTRAFGSLGKGRVVGSFSLSF